MAVGAYFAVVAVCQEPLGLAHGSLSIEPDQGGQIELEMDAKLAQSVIARFVQVSVALRMGEQRPVSRALYFTESVVKSERRGPGGCLHKEGVTFHRQQVTVSKTLFKDRVEHIFCRKVELYRAGVGLLQFFEPCLQCVCLVGTVLHYMRRAP